MPLDPSLPLQIQQPNPAAFISSFVDLGRKKLELDKARETYTTDIEASKARSASDVARSKVDTANVQPLIEQQAAQTQGAQAVASGQQLATMRQHILNAKQQTSELLTAPDSELTPDVIKASLVSSLKNSGASDAAIAQATSQIPPAGSSAKDLRKFILRGLMQATDANTQLDRQYPNPMMVNTGQEIKPVASGNPATTGVAPGESIGKPTQMQPPPTTEVYNPNTQQRELLGPKPGGVTGPVATGPRIGETEGTLGPIARNNEHYAQTQIEGNAAPNRISSLQVIKQEIPTAIMGKGGWGEFLRKANQIYGGDATTSADIIAKNLAMIASQAGNTDAARVLGELGSPNKHMTEKAGNEAADQLIGIEMKKQAASAYFTGTPTNSPAYAQKIQMWNKSADPRAFEFAAKSAAEQAAMKAAMQKAGTWDALRQKMIQLHAMGVNPGEGP